jgi:multiple sugar transport system substrate-binding protein
MNKRFLAAAASAALLIGTMVGCGAPEASQGTELRMTWFGGQARSTMTNKLLDAFEASHPGIKVAREPTTEDQYNEKVITQSVGGNAPDVVMANSFSINDFVKRGVLSNLDNLVAAKTIDLSDFEAPDVKGGQVDGKQYLIPWGHILTGVIYNTATFAKAGVPAPALNWTWDDYVATAKKLQPSLGPDTWAMENDGGSYRDLEAFAVQRGKSLFSADGLAISKQDLTEWYTMWDELRKAGVVPPPAIQKEQGAKTQEQSMFAKGKVAMLSTSSNQLPSLQAVTKGAIDITSYPWVSGGEKKTPMIISAVGVSAKSKHQKEAGILINWMVNDPEAAKIFNAEQGQPPAKAMRAVIAPQVSDLTKKGFKFADDMKSETVTYPSMPGGSASVQTLIMTENEAVGFGTKTIPQAVDDFFAQAAQILKK